MKRIMEGILCFILVCVAIILAISPIIFLTVNRPETRQDRADKAAEIIINEQVFDTSALREWCGNPVETIRMIGAWAYDENTFEDEAGNLWGWDGVKEQAFYLLWIDDMGTPQIEDDQIIKVFEERG